MRALSLGMMIVFGLAWLATVAARELAPQLLEGMPGIAGSALRTALDWAGTQTLGAMALCCAAYLCFSTGDVRFADAENDSGIGHDADPESRPASGARLWGSLALIAILPLLALAVAQFDPRVVARLQSSIGPAFDALRAAQPDLRLGLFTGVALIGAAHLIGAGRGWWPRAVTLAVIASLILTLAGSADMGTAILALPALVLLAQTSAYLAEHDHPAAPYILTGALCVIAGAALELTGSSPRQDIRPGFVLLPLFAALAHRMRPRLPTAALWLHAALIGLVLAYLAPGLGQWGDVRPATSLAEISQALRRAEALRNGMGLILALLAALGVLSFLFRRQARHRPAERG